MRALLVAAAILAAFLGAAMPVEAAQKEEVELVLVKEPIPLNVDVYVKNNGPDTLWVIVHWVSTQGGRVTEGDKIVRVEPHKQAFVGKAQNSLIKTTFRITAVKRMPIIVKPV
jgi:hypothetical protein